MIALISNQFNKAITDNSMILIVEIRSNYGTDLVYPLCKKSLAFCDIAKTRTLTTRTIKELRSIGYSFKVINRESDLIDLLTK